MTLTRRSFLSSSATAVAAVGLLDARSLTPGSDLTKEKPAFVLVNNPAISRTPERQIAVDDAGQAFPYTITFFNDSAAADYMGRHPDATAQSVSEFRQVQNHRGEAVNQASYAGWGFDPLRN